MSDKHKAMVPSHKILLCMAYPYEKADFLRCFQRGMVDYFGSMDLAQLPVEVAWLRYSGTATFIETYIKELKSRNVDVINLYDVNDLREAVDYDVVIILANHIEDRDVIELMDGSVSTSIFASSFLWMKDCTIDISSCFSMTFRQLQEFFFPTCHLLETNAKPSLNIRLWLIKEIVKRLADDYSKGYVDTLQDVYVDILKMRKEDVYCHDYMHKSYLNRSLPALISVCSGIRFDRDTLRQDLKHEIQKIIFDYCLKELESNNDFDAMRIFCMNSLIMQKDNSSRQSLMRKIVETVVDHCYHNLDSVEEFCISIMGMKEGANYYEFHNNNIYRDFNPFDEFEACFCKSSRQQELLEDPYRSSVYAPKFVLPGQAFMVQLFIHKQKDSSEVEIMASTVDMETGKRNSNYLSLPLKRGDTIKVRLEAIFDKKSEFEIDESDKVIIWNDEYASVDYVVKVNDNCSSDAFFGRLRICCNCQPVGDIQFKVVVYKGSYVPSEDRNTTFDFSPYDKKREAKDAIELLQRKINDNISLLEKQKSTPDGSFQVKNVDQELDINRHCLKLLKNNKQKKSSIKVVFISSTSDLKESRETVRRAIEKNHMYPEMYENWPQGNIYPRDKCIEKVLSSDIFICILGANYGRVEPMWDMSMTEIEYRAALLSGKNYLVYIDKQYESKMDSIENQKYKQRQLDLINELQGKRMVQFFDDQASLESIVQRDLSETIKGMENTFSDNDIQVPRKRYRMRGYDPSL